MLKNPTDGRTPPPKRLKTPTKEIGYKHPSTELMVQDFNHLKIGQESIETAKTLRFLLKPIFEAGDHCRRVQSSRLPRWPG